MIEIKEVEKIDQEIEEFQKAEWIPADIDHFGRKIDWKLACQSTLILNLY